MKENLAEGFNQEEEKEEMRRYGIKKKQKKKTRINLVIIIILGIILFLVLIWIYYLKRQIVQKDYNISILLSQNENLKKSINEGNMEIERLTTQYQNIQNKAFTLLEKCYDDTSSLKSQINDLQKEAAENEEKRKNEIAIPKEIASKLGGCDSCNIF